jgi:hypothetical protein
MIPANWDWQRKSANRSGMLAEFLIFPCPIRALCGLKNSRRHDFSNNHSAITCV